MGKGKDGMKEEGRGFVFYLLTVGGTMVGGHTHFLHSFSLRYLKQIPLADRPHRSQIRWERDRISIHSIRIGGSHPLGHEPGRQGQGARTPATQAAGAGGASEEGADQRVRANSIDSRDWKGERFRRMVLRINFGKNLSKIPGHADAADLFPEFSLLFWVVACLDQLFEGGDLTAKNGTTSIPVKNRY